MATKSVMSRLSPKMLSSGAFDKFRANRRWLQQALDGFSPLEGERERIKTHVLLYGSALSGTALRDGDADYAVVFSRQQTEAAGNGAPIASAHYDIEREKQEAVLASLFRHIGERATGEALRPQRIFRARIPIVQYVRKTAEEEDMKFDVSLSINGVKNSLLLRKYMEKDPRLHLGVMCTKQWGREAKILNARRGWISPYALTIMYIHFMVATGRTAGLIDEHCVELEVAKLLASSAEDDDESDVGFAIQNEGVPLLDTAVEAVQQDVYDFFSFYGSPSMFDFDVSIVDIRKNNSILDKEAWLGMLGDLPQVDRWHLLGHENIMLRDPYESHNLGRSVDFFRGEAIREAFRVAAVQRAPLSFLNSS